MRVRIALGAAASVLSVALLVALAGSARRIAGSNRVPNPAFAATLLPGASICQRSELVPADTAALRMTIASYGKPTPPVAYTLTAANGAQVAGGSLSGGYHEGLVELPLATRVSVTRPDARFCLTDAGRVKIVLAGVAPYGGTGATLEMSDGTVTPGALRIDYLRPGRESWLALTGVLAHRLTLGKGSLTGGWSWAGALLLMFCVVAFCARALLTSEPRA